MKDKTALTARQKRFVEEYLACGDGPEAAIAAGYSPATAEERARELLRDHDRIDRDPSEIIPLAP